jgi:hypothetical protein
MEIDMSMNFGFCYSLIQKRDIQEYFFKISNIVLHHSFFPYKIKMKILNKKVCHGRHCNIATTSFAPTLGCYDDDVL